LEIRKPLDNSQRHPVFAHKLRYSCFENVDHAMRHMLDWLAVEIGPHVVDGLNSKRRS
jgi:hypothetical protein